MKSKHDSKTGKFVGGHFQLLERIGSGSFGEIYRGRDLCSDEYIAIKLVFFKCMYIGTNFSEAETIKARSCYLQGS